MSTVVAVVVMDHTILMVITTLVHHIGVDHNHHLTDNLTTLIDINPTALGVLVVMVLSTVTEVLEDARVLLLSMNSKDK